MIILAKKYWYWVLILQYFFRYWYCFSIFRIWYWYWYFSILKAYWILVLLFCTGQCSAIILSKDIGKYALCVVWIFMKQTLVESILAFFSKLNHTQFFINCHLLNSQSTVVYSNKTLPWIIPSILLILCINFMLFSNKKYPHLKAMKITIPEDLIRGNTACWFLAKNLAF